MPARPPGLAMILVLGFAVLGVVIVALRLGADHLAKTSRPAGAVAHLAFAAAIDLVAFTFLRRPDEGSPARHPASSARQAEQHGDTGTNWSG
jgi:hypothetical protein